MKTKTLVGALLGLVIVVGVVWAFWHAYQPRALVLQGQLEARQYMVSSKVPGRLGEVLVEKGARVTADQVVFRIDSPELEAKLAQIRSLDRIATALVDAVEGGTREEKVAAARSEFQKAQAAETLTRKTWQRIKALAEEGLVPAQRLDEAYTAWQLASKTRVTAGEILKLAEAGPRQEARDASRSGEAVTASLAEEVQELLDDTRVNARHDGVVTDVLLQPGELVPQGFPVVMVTDLKDAWALFNVREDLLRHFADGEQFSLYLPALQQTHRFAVSHVAVLGDFATWQSSETGQGFDLRTFEVEMKPLEPVEGLRPGMSAVLTLEP